MESESGMNIVVAGLGPKNAKDYCEIEMLNERLENARVAAGAVVNSLKGSVTNIKNFSEFLNFFDVASSKFD